MGNIKEIIKRYELLQESEIKLKEYYDILLQWINLYQRGKTLSDYFVKEKLSRIAIYGTKELGISLYKELEDTDIEVAYFIDKSNLIEMNGITTIAPCEIKPVDAIVVTAVHYFFEIKKELSDITDARIISIEDVVFGL